MINEIWKPVKHYEDLYEISNYGRVRSLTSGKYLTQHDNGRGYLSVNLWKNDKSKREYVHRLVALAFIPNPEGKPQVNHRDEDKQNNYYENLEWVTCKENNNYGTHIERVVNTCIQNGVYEQFSARMKANNPNKGQFQRGKNAYAKKVICDGVIFDCLKDCAEFYGINYGTFRNYLCRAMPKRFEELGLAYA